LEKEDIGGRIRNEERILGIRCLIWIDNLSVCQTIVLYRYKEKTEIIIIPVYYSQWDSIIPETHLLLLWNRLRYYFWEYFKSCCFGHNWKYIHHAAFFHLYDGIFKDPKENEENKIKCKLSKGIIYCLLALKWFIYFFRI